MRIASSGRDGRDRPAVSRACGDTSGAARGRSLETGDERVGP